MAVMHDEESSAPARPSPNRLRLSTDFVPEGDRVAFLREELASLVQMKVELLGDRPPRYVIESILAGPVAVSMVGLSATCVSRTAGQVADGDDGFLFVLQTQGRQEISHNSRQTMLNPGDACLVRHSTVGSSTFPEGGEALAVRIEGEVLRALVREPEVLTGRLIERSRPGMRLLKGYLRSLPEEDMMLTPGLCRTVGLHVADLVSSIIGNTPHGAAQAECGGVRAARLQRVLDSIAACACDQGFSVETVAAELQVTSRTVQLMLEESGSTFSERVAEHRLRRAWQLLVDAKSHLPIAEVAYEAGFNDLSYFYRAFRRRFGETPGRARGVRASPCGPLRATQH